MTKPKTPASILLEAFNEIKEHHGIALTEVEFELIDTGSIVEQDRHVVNIGIKGVALHKGGE